MEYGLLAFKNYPQHLLHRCETCSDKEEIVLDFISHAEGKDAGDAFYPLIQCCCSMLLREIDLVGCCWCLSSRLELLAPPGAAPNKC